MRLIDADALSAQIYHEAFETDTDMQKWDSGCWIRYRMFENAINNAPTIKQPEIIMCKNCKNYEREWETRFPHMHYCAVIDGFMPENGFCNYAERM